MLVKMVNRRFLSLLLLLIPSCFPAFSDAATIRTFGPESGPELVLTAEAGANASIRHDLDTFAERLSLRIPSCRISVAITETADAYRGQMDLASSLEGNESCAVVIFRQTEGNGVTIHAGAGGRTTPRWLLETVTAAAERAEYPWKLAENRLSLYRIGWKEGDPLLALYLSRDIPAVLVETGGDISALADGIAATFPDRFSTLNDRHYLSLSFNGKLFFVGEAAIAVIMIIASAIILFSLFFFSFLFGKKSDQHLRDLMRVWWLPLLYFAVNVLALIGGQALTDFLCALRFGNHDAWKLLPQAALITKILLSWFLMTLVVSLNQLIHFPDDSFIYGYIASVVCMINFFVLSSLDFSLTPIFLAMYLVSYLAYHFSRPAPQILSIVALAVPFAPYIAVLFSESAGLGPIILGSGLWNVRIALFIMPFQLMLSRLFHTVGIFGSRQRFYVPVNLVVSFFAAVASVAVFLFMPAWSPARPLEVTIRQTIRDGDNAITTSSLARPEKFIPVPDSVFASAPDTLPVPSSFIGISSTSRKFLERQLVTITVSTAIPASRMEILVTAENGISVYDATQDFTLEDGGRQCRFIIDAPDGMKSVNIGFSSDYSSQLTASARILSSENPWGMRIPANFVKSVYILDVTETARIVRPTGERSAE
jgi:hypothetical protein